MLVKPTPLKINQVFVPGLLFWRREKRQLLRRWRRWMVLPETTMLAGLVLFFSVISGHFDYAPGQQALAAVGGVFQDGAPGGAAFHRHAQTAQARIFAHPESMLSMSAEEILAAFSYPDLKRNEGSVSILQFRGESCVLEVYLREGRSSPVGYEFHQRRIAGEDQKEPGVSAPAPVKCIDDIMRAHHT